MSGFVELASSPSPLWYATRAGGTIALVLLTATVTLGIAVGGRYSAGPLARFEISNLHRNLSVLTLAFLALHIVTAISDTFVHLSWWVTVIPFAASYRPLWLGLGTVAFDLLLAIGLTSAVRLRIGRNRWKSVHGFAYLAWPLAVFHGAGTGTDTRLSWQLALYAVCVATVVAAVGRRLYVEGPGNFAERVGAGVVTALIPLMLALFLTSGPLRPGWAQRAIGESTVPVTGTTSQMARAARPTFPTAAPDSGPDTASPAAPAAYDEKALVASDGKGESA